MDFEAQKRHDVAVIEQALTLYLPESTEAQRTVVEAMRYSLLAPGKRLRPILCLEFCKLCGGTEQQALPFAAAIEMIHTYSLIHDDLPCMDNDDLRRGRLTCHKVYGEAAAILAGDGLLTAAFETVLERSMCAPVVTLQCLQVLAKAAGARGMVGGQMIDMESQWRAATESDLKNLQGLKTGALIDAAVQMGCLAGGASTGQRKAAADFARHLGLAFQIQDDILDVTGDVKSLGKRTGLDEENRKTTFVSMFGLAKASAEADRLLRAAKESLSVFAKPEFLITLCDQMSRRQR